MQESAPSAYLGSKRESSFAHATPAGSPGSEAGARQYTVKQEVEETSRNHLLYKPFLVVLADFLFTSSLDLTCKDKDGHGLVGDFDVVQTIAYVVLFTR